MRLQLSDQGRSFTPFRRASFNDENSAVMKALEFLKKPETQEAIKSAVPVVVNAVKKKKPVTGTTPTPSKSGWEQVFAPAENPVLISQQAEIARLTQENKSLQTQRYYWGGGALLLGGAIAMLLKR